MGAYARSPARERHPRRWRGEQVRRAGLLLLEYVAIAAGYVFLGWLGHLLRLDGQLVTFWPAGGFALGMLLLRGTSRWPAILVGSQIVTWKWVLGASAYQPFVHDSLISLLVSAARVLSTVAGVWLIRRVTGTTRWPHTVRGVLGFLAVSGVAYPVLATFMTDASLMVGGLGRGGQGFLQEAWLWFVANSVGVVVVTPFILALAEAPFERPPRSRREVALGVVLFLATGFIAFGFARWTGRSIPLAYPLLPIMIWAPLRFGSRGAVFNNLLWTAAVISVAMSEPLSANLTLTFAEYHARLAVLTSAFLVLAAAFEERYRMQNALEKERQGLEARVAERTRELARFLSLLHSSLESTADGLLVVDRGGHITVQNQRFAELWRIPPAILERGDDARALAFVREQLMDPQSFLSRVEHLYAHPAQESADEVLLRDGRIFQRVSRPQRMGEELVGRVWSFRDITFRRRAEAERDRLFVEEQRARQEAERAFREAQRALGLRDEFLSIAAHEMKTPLTSMKIQIQRLQRLLDSPAHQPVEAARLRPVVTAALRQMRRFEALSDELLDFTQLTSGEFKPSCELLDFREVVEEALQHHAEAAERAGSELSLECAGPIVGESDPRCLQRIVSNLVSNALKFGAGHPLTVRLDANAELVYLQVTDQGIGIAPEDHARIFERLERAVDSRHYGGLGLGLWLVRQSVEALRGHVSVDSALGRGSTFTVELPRTRPASALAEHPPELAVEP